MTRTTTLFPWRVLAPSSGTLINAVALDTLLMQAYALGRADVFRERSVANACRRCGRDASLSSAAPRPPLCGICAALGCLAWCAACGENFPEHGPGGAGCATFLDPQEAPDAPA
jgi:hypothetical protein